jgi:hypothetical protein
VSLAGFTFGLWNAYDAMKKAPAKPVEQSTPAKQ